MKKVKTHDCYYLVLREGTGKNTIICIDENKYQQLAKKIISKNLHLFFPAPIAKYLAKRLDILHFE